MAKCSACRDEECSCTPPEHKETYLYRMFGSLFPAVHGEGGSFAFKHSELSNLDPAEVDEQIEEDHKGG